MVRYFVATIAVLWLRSVLRVPQLTWEQYTERFHVIKRITIVNLLLLKRSDEPIVQDVLLGFPCAVPANDIPVSTLKGESLKFTAKQFIKNSNFPTYFSAHPFHFTRYSMLPWENKQVNRKNKWMFGDGLEVFVLVSGAFSREFKRKHTTHVYPRSQPVLRLTSYRCSDMV